MTTCAPATASLRSTAPRIFVRMPSTSRCSMSRIVTGNPAAAHAWAIPAPIVPAPITAIFRTSAASVAATVPRGEGTADVKPAFIRDCGRLISPPRYGRGRGPPMSRPPRSLVLALAIVLALASIVAVTPRAAAAQNRPSWTQGDFWVYARTAGSETSTIRLEVIESTTLTLTSGTYSVWHVTSTTTDAGGNVTVQNIWIQESNLGLAKANFSTPFGDAQVTFDPPLAQAVFPLSLNAQWSLTTTVRLVDISFSFPLAYSATVIAEHSTTVDRKSTRLNSSHVA